MSQHKVDELLSLPIEKREYRKCSEGTLYIPEDVVEKLLEVLQSAKGNYEQLPEFELELSRIISDLERGLGTGEVIDSEEDEFIPKRFDDVKLKLAAVMGTLVELKQEVVATKDTKIEDEFPKLKS